MKAIGLLLFISLLVKLVLSAWIPLSADEAYYWVWSHSPSIGYFDHPPFVAWLYWLGQVFENFHSAIRWPGVILGQLSLLIWVLILRPFLSEKALFWFVVLALFSPMTGPGSLIITPDTPLIFFWSILIWGMVSAKDSTNYLWPLFLGLVLGLGFLSKYTVVLFFPIAIAVFIYARWSVSRLLISMGLGILGFALTSWPVWLWNMNHDWISFNFQARHGLGAKVWKPSWTSEYIFAQIAFIFPTVLFVALKNKGTPFWLKLAAWLPIVFFLLTSFRGYAEANWPIVAYFPILGLAVWSAKHFSWARLTVGIWAVALTLILSLIGNFWLPLDKSEVKLKELFLSGPLRDFADSHEGEVYARSYQMASKLSFELKKPIYKLRGMNRFDFYDMHPESIPTQQDFWLIAEPGDITPFGLDQRYQKMDVIDIDNNLQAWRFVRR